MILRKPYAFLIKHFKLIHLIITFFMALSLIKSIDVISFFGEYAANESKYVGQQFSDVVYPTIVFIAPIIVIIFSLILLGTMAAKKKPFVLYVINIITYIVALVLIIIGNSVVIQLEKTLVDLRLGNLIRDFTTIMLLVQLYPICKNLVRGIGFDVKQFDFKRDLQELEIEEKDSEEFEVSVSFDINKVKRLKNTGLRNIKYFYLEHKKIVNISAIVIVVAITGLTVLGITKTNNTLNYNAPVSMDGLVVRVLKSYATRLDNTGNVVKNLGEDNTLIVVPITITNNSNAKKELVTANIELKVGGKKYRHISYFRDPIYDLGNTYQNDEIDKKETKRVNLVYEIPTKYLDSKMTLKFITSIDSTGKKLIPTYSNLKLNIINLDINKTEVELVKNEPTTLSNSTIGDTSITIKNIELDRKFKINYNLCVTKSKCIPSYEYLYAPLNTNEDRALMKINSEIVYDENYKLSSLNYLYDLINTFGTIEYTKDNTTKKIKTFNKVNPLATKSNNIIFISVPMDMLDADNIVLNLNIRNKQYNYVIK